MKFEDTGLPDTPQTRLGFDQAVIESTMVHLSNPHLKDDGVSPGSLTLMVRAAQILNETVPNATPEQLAAAMMFPTYSFGQPVLMRRAHGQDLPDVAEWSQEWRNVQRGTIFLAQASVELRQIITAVNTAMMEGYAANFQTLDFWGVHGDMMEKNRMALDMGDFQAPALAAKQIAAAAGVEQLIAGVRKPPGTGGIKPPRP